MATATVILIATLFGLLGGLIRSAVGIAKLKNIAKQFNARYLTGTLMLAGLIGAIVAFTYTTSTIFYLAIGYAGTDFLQGIWKAGKKK